MRQERQARMYRFNPRDTTGWLLGLQGPQAISFAVAIIVSAFLFRSGIPPMLALFPLLAAAFYSFGVYGGRRAYEWIPIVTEYIKRRVSTGLQWYAPLPMITGTDDDRALQPSLPPCMTGLNIVEVDAPWARRGTSEKVALVVDSIQNSVTCVMPVVGREFGLVDRSEQERLIESWGAALSVFCRERSPISRVTWTEWAAPSGVDDHRFYLEETRKAPDDSPALHAYLDLLDTAGPMVTTHEVLVSITIDISKVKPNKRTGEDSKEAARKICLEEMRLLTTRLETANLMVGDPLSAAELARALRVRMDPDESLRFAARNRALHNSGRLVSMYNLAPTVVQAEWKHVRVDGAFHRAYWVAQWPRLDVPSDWMSGALLNATGVRTIGMIYEPVPMSKSQRQVDRDSTKLVTDEAQREKHGFRVGASHKRAQQAVLEREQEIVAGYSEFEFAGIVIVSAQDLGALDEAAAEYEQIAAQCGLELRSLDGLHDTAWVATLPFGRGLAARMMKF